MKKIFDVFFVILIVLLLIFLAFNFSATREQNKILKAEIKSLCEEIDSLAGSLCSSMVSEHNAFEHLSTDLKNSMPIKNDFQKIEKENKELAFKLGQINERQKNMSEAQTLLFGTSFQELDLILNKVKRIKVPFDEQWHQAGTIILGGGQ